VLMLRYKQPGNREWKTPLNFNIGGREFPLGLMLITATLFTLAVVNVLTKRVATISGVAFTIAFFTVFEISEQFNKRTRQAHGQESEKFRLDTHSDVSRDAIDVRPGNILVAVRNPNRLQHLDRILRKTDTRKMDIVVLSVRSLKSGAGEFNLEPGQMFAEAETEVFSKVVTLAEKAGKHVELMVVPGSDPYDAAVRTAARLQSSRIVMGLSPKLTPAEQGAQVGAFWEKLPEPRPSLSLELVFEDQKDVVFFNLGPQPPRLWPEDIDLVHKLWLELQTKGPGAKLHHRDIVGVALRRMEAELHSSRADEVVRDVQDEVANSTGAG